MKPLWSPDAKRINNSAMQRFAGQLGIDAREYPQLHRWSVDNREAFWSKLWDFCAIAGDKGGAPYLEHAELLPGSRWFPSARLNYAENLLQRRDDHPALIEYKENGQRKSITYRHLYLRVAGLAAALRRDGLVAGDRVAGYLPNMIDTVVAMLASSSIGAIWTSCSPDFGDQGLLDRFGQVAPKVLFCVDGYYYNGKVHDCLPRVRQLLPQLPSVERVVVIPYISDTPGRVGIERAELIDNYLDAGATECQFEALPFDHPLFILYSSGTTGKPKCIMHGAGGALLEHRKEHVLHTDLNSKSVFFYYTTCGWMMWNWLVSGLASGASLVLFDGSPFYPRDSVLLDLIDREKISIFGTSAKYISALEKAGLTPKDSQRLDSLVTILSTGSPLAVESYYYVYEKIKSDVLLSSIAGGTDLLGAFASGNPCLPVYAGELQCAGLALDVDVLDDEGHSLRGSKGEMVCRRSFPSVPLQFWNDAGDTKFHNAYFARFENIWAHGDYAEITGHNGLIIYGRSDSLLNPGGVRIGTAEIYRQVEKIEDVVESIAIGQDWKDDCRVILFVILREGVWLNDDIEERIKSVIKTNTTPRHIPARIIQVSDIPRTLSGKIVEVAVREIVHNRPVKNTEALANPQALDLYKNLPELQS